MADIKTLEDQDPSFSPSLSPSASPSAAPDEDESVTTGTKGKSVPTALMDAFKKTDKAALIIGVVIMGLVFTIYQLVLPAIQITKEYHQDYKAAVDKLNNEKYGMLEERVKQLESQNRELKARVYFNEIRTR